jgi:hypothetical protein
MARGFFERLWWYDQIVFDASSNKDNSASKSPSFEKGKR